jgi:hypothetical protein
MFSVIFEVLPAEGKKDDYLEIAKHLKPGLESTDGSSTTSDSRANGDPAGSCRIQPGVTRNR